MSLHAENDRLSAWVGSLPEGWRCDWLKWHVDCSTVRPTDEQQATLPYLSNEDIESWTGRLLREDLAPAEADSRLFKAGDVLFNKLRPYLAKVFRAEFDGVSSGELLCLRPSDRVDARYLFYVLTSHGLIDSVDAQTFGSKMPRADWEIIGHQPLPLPHIDVQQRIANFLDEKTAQIDALIDKKRALLERLTEQRQALITRAVTKGLNPDVPMKRSGVEWLGDVPAHWVVKPLKRIKQYLTSGSRDWAAFYADEGDPFLRMTNVTGDGVELNLTDLRYVSLDGEQEGVRTQVRNGDILITITAELGAVAIVRDQFENGAFINQHLALFRAFPEISDSEFLVNLLSTNVAREQFVVSGNGGTKQGLGFDQVGGVIAAFPDLIEQKKIAGYCFDVRLKFDRIRAPIRGAIEQFIDCRSALITSAITGQLPELNG